MRNTYTHTRKCMRKYYYRAGERMDHSINDESSPFLRPSFWKAVPRIWAGMQGFACEVIPERQSEGGIMHQQTVKIRRLVFFSQHRLDGTVMLYGNM